ncbi:hypothetical protein [Geoalkalibacter halelectricus]|uniref:hypothetical protein n=1 Tax=Geoalkalibacter halelectricus TaxID=2847045 RepID=UPI00266FA2E4|nr:hypothetical protein [Geoalkalibacter halelectricus]MDO3380387.1 hypothetical protein [Geoalkalibacter halelectricus]
MSKSNNKKTVPEGEQLEQLKFNFVLPEREKDYSRAIEFYDLLPKYQHGQTKSKLVEGQFLPDLIKHWKYRGEEYEVSIVPGRTGVGGIYAYPGAREELIEDVLRKLAVEGQAYWMRLREEGAGVIYTLYQIKKELSSRLHSMSVDEIKQGLFVAGTAKITVRNKKNPNSVRVFSIFPEIGIKSDERIENEEGKAWAYVQFSPYVTEAIRAGNTYLINYEQLMSYKTPLQRWIHRKLALVYRGATMFNPYGPIKLTTIISEYGRELHKDFRKNVDYVNAALEKLTQPVQCTNAKGKTEEKKGILSHFTVKKIYDPKRSNKIIDAEYTLWPSADFVSDIKKANYFRKFKELGEPEKKIP